MVSIETCVVPHKDLSDAIILLNEQGYTVIGSTITPDHLYKLVFRTRIPIIDDCNPSRSWEKKRRSWKNIKSKQTTNN